MRIVALLLLSACAGCVTSAPPSPTAAAPAALPPLSDRTASGGMSVYGKPLTQLTVAPDQLALIKSDDPKLARNKKVVWDFWRIVYENGHMERAPEFMTPEYVQHNPNIESGRDAFVRTMSKSRPVRPVGETSRFPIINIIAERDIVVVMWARKVRDREKPDEIYEMTWFDVFRVDDKTGKIAEHWDSSERWGSSGRPPGAEFFP
jgi:predicted SnoaL-like aldol condensation-catalyzing enzyme